MKIKKIIIVSIVIIMLYAVSGCMKQSKNPKYEDPIADEKIEDITVNNMLSQLGNVIDEGKQPGVWSTMYEDTISVKKDRKEIVSFHIKTQARGTLNVTIRAIKGSILAQEVYILDDGEIYSPSFLLIPPKDATAVITIAFEAISKSTNKLEMSDIYTRNYDYQDDYVYLKMSSNSKLIAPANFDQHASLRKKDSLGGADELFRLEYLSESVVLLRHLLTNRVIGVPNESDTEGELVCMDSYFGDLHQQWMIEQHPNAPKSFRFINEGSGLALDYLGADSLPLVQKAPKGSGQYFELVKAEIFTQLTKHVVPNVSTTASWKKNVIISPKVDSLVPTGNINIRWANVDTRFTSYEIWLNGNLIDHVTATDEAIMEHTVYSTLVQKNAVRIEGYQGKKKVVSEERFFYTSKKGGASGVLSMVEELNISWYYHWSTSKAFGTPVNLEFVPMIWGKGNEAWLQNEANFKYKQVLGYNEPDLKDQSNMDVTTVVNLWKKHWTNTSFRVGSPCSGVFAGWSNNWFVPFMAKIEEEVDFIAVHFYYYEDKNPETYLKLLDALHHKYQKPIWITEFGCARWPEQDNLFDTERIKAWMEVVLPELDEREYIERYSWFPFNPNSQQSGNYKGGIYNHQTGILTELGQIYSRLGLPEGYEPK